MTCPERRANRLPDYNYAESGWYFVTFCTTHRRPLLSRVAPTAEGAETVLLPAGKIVAEGIACLNGRAEGFGMEKYVIMPNHVHLLIAVSGEEPGKSVSSLIRRLKSFTSRRYGEKLWQRSFYDHIVRGEADFREIWRYIDENPLRWALDEYYKE